MGVAPFSGGPRGICGAMPATGLLRGTPFVRGPGAGFGGGPGATPPAAGFGGLG